MTFVVSCLAIWFYLRWRRARQQMETAQAMNVILYSLITEQETTTK